MKTCIFACVIALAAGCGSSSSPPADDGGGSGMDGGASDAGSMMGTDAGPMGVDAGPMGADAGPMGTDAGTTQDAGPDVCTADSPCPAGGVCTGGPLCEDTWRFSFTPMPCTDDEVEYCGCDGAVFTGSSTCPDRPFAHMGRCAGADGFDCDRSRVTCRALEPTCPAGQVAEVEGTCWTFRCVPLTDCRCADASVCPGDATCDAGAMRCQPAP